ncbi:4Fe-4S dicluster domain-containing protein [Sulfurimonas sp. CVO]|jgi:ferredoxin-type protein NapG|uniref:4Fe-4S dicluster domain-containing protein n=1 Tax=Sulfurimonas xiamenensis TaxID=2590021 RepID=A0AAJ4DMX9_9BACT|nr:MULTISPECIES: 4Fe-4S dicluster domain-containing protein [Sulfurimonas]QFR43491.1 4Fe-4S dicluster domain-containing protein [Sulfurimonas xiamenensis]QHG90942.1 4Fe-4S dicluster domain-containing protein [Sulfurimonas sp. CVO]
METVKTDKREFIKYSTLGVLGLVLGGGMIFSPYTLRAENRLRPPGAVDEKRFLALCIKCGQCLQVCPYHSIKLADFGRGHGVGTPYIDANERGCWACSAVPCVLACPSGALDHHCEKPEDIKMGIAVLEFPDTCLAMTNTPVPKGYNEKMHKFTNSVVNKHELEEQLLEKFDQYEGKQCTLCADMCPIPNPLSAIAMVPDSGGGNKPEIYDGCIGCGACQEVCPTTIPSIVIKPRMTYEEYYANKS